MSELLPQVQRVGAYAVITRGDQILLTRLSATTSRPLLWTLPGGGVEHGEDPGAAVVREVYEETGLAATVGDTVRVFSTHYPTGMRGGDDFHAIRLVYAGAVPADSPAPHVVDVGGTSTDAAWIDLADVRSGAVATVGLVGLVVDELAASTVQRLSAYALMRRGTDVLLTRISERGHHPGAWTLPGGGINHGESPPVAVAREVAEEAGLAVEVGALLGVHDLHFTGTAPTGAIEDFHGVHLIYAAIAHDDRDPVVREVGGTTDAVAWLPVETIQSGQIEVLEVVRYALGQESGFAAPAIARAPETEPVPPH